MSQLHLPPRAARSARGFTLIEILVSAGIFGIGLIAVASIFPTAIQLQKQTIEQIRGSEYANAVQATVLQRGFDARAVAADAPVPAPTDTSETPTVFSSPRAVEGDTGFNPEAVGWSPADRSSGSLEIVGAVGTQFNYGGRNLFWTPLFIDRNRNPVPDPASTDPANTLANRDWSVFLFVTRSNDVAPTPTTPASGYTRTPAGAVAGYALDDSAGQDPIDSNSGNSIVPGIAQINATAVARMGADRARFDFANTGLRVADGSEVMTGRIVRVGDGILGADGTTYVVAVSEVDGVEVNGPITVPNGPTTFWAAHPGTSGESSFVDLIQLVNNPNTNNLVRR